MPTKAQMQKQIDIQVRALAMDKRTISSYEEVISKKDEDIAHMVAKNIELQNKQKEYLEAHNAQVAQDEDLSIRLNKMTEFRNRVLRSNDRLNSRVDTLLEVITIISRR
jgi:hypothetical protein